MADAFRGLTIRLGADARPLNSAISSISHSAQKAQTQLNAMNKALRFDPTNTSAMAARIDLMGDKALLAARAVNRIETAMSQVSAETKEVAAANTHIYSAVERVRSGYNHTNASLQRIYDSVRRIYAAENGLDAKSEEVASHIKSIQLNYGGASEKARELTAEMDKLLAKAADTKTMKDRFGLEGAENAAEKLTSVYQNLRSEHRRFVQESSTLKEAEGFRAMQTQMIAWEAELKQATMEMAKFKSELYSVQSGEGVGKLLNRIQRIDGEIDQATASVRRMDEAFKKMPSSVQAATMKLNSEKAAMESLSDKAEALRGIIKSIESTAGFDKLEASTRNVHKWASEAEHGFAEFAAKAKVAEERLNHLEAEMKEFQTVNFIGPQRSLETVEKELKEVSAEFTEATQKADHFDEELRKANKARAYRQAAEDLNVLETELNQARTKASALRRVLDFSKTIRTMGYGLYSTLTPAIMIAGRYAIQSAREIDSAYRDMRKTVNGTEAEFEHLKDAALEFSKSHVTSAEQILEIESIGGQLGIAASDLEAFSETISNLDVSTNIDAESVSEQLGKMASVVDISVDEYDNFGDALVRLGNNMPVMESDIMTVTTRFMGMGKVVGMTADQMLGWAAAASATGQKSEAAGSAMQRFISKMETAVVGGGETLEKWASVAGMSAQEFADAFNTSASDAMYSFIEGLGRIQKEGGLVNQTLQDLKINNVRDKQLLEGLAVQMTNTTNGATLLGEALQMSNDAYRGLATRMADGTIEEAGDAAREAGRKAEGFSGQIEMMIHNAQLLSSELASGALPYVKAIGAAFDSATAAVKEMPDEMKSAIVGVLGLAAAVGPLAVGFGAVGSAIDTFLEAANKATGTRTLKTAETAMLGMMEVGDKFKETFPAAGAAIEKFGGKLKSATAFAKAGAPVFIALAAAAVMLVKHFQEIKASADAYVKATDGIVKASGNAITAQKGLANATNAVGKAQYDAVGSAKAILESQGQLVDKMNERADATRTEITNLTKAEEAIDKYLNKTGLTVKEQGELRAAIKLLNEQYNTQYQVVDAANGMVADERGVLLNTKDAILEYIEAKKLQIQADQLANDMVEAGAALDKTTAAWVEARKERDAYYNTWGDMLGKNKVDDQGRNIDDRLEELEYAVAVAEGTMKANETAYDAIESSWDMLAETTEHASQSIEDLAFRQGILQELFKDDSNGFTAFRSELAKTGISVDDFKSISTRDWADIVTEWNNGEVSLETILSGMGYELVSLTDRARTSFGELGLDFDDFVSQLGGNAEELASKLQSAGGAAKVFANVTEQDIANALAESEGNIDTFIAKLQEYGQQNVSAEVHAEGAEEAASEMNQVTDATAEADGATATAYADDEGTEEVVEDYEGVQDTVDETDGDSATVYAYISGSDTVNSAINSIRNNLKDLDGSSATVTVNRVGGDAAGGFYKLHAFGGFITNGPTALGYDRFGTLHIAGEAGREWVKRHADGTTSILPIENKRYLKPYAREIAGMIGGAGTVNNYNITLDYKAGDDANKIVRDLGFALRTSAMMEG